MLFGLGDSAVQTEQHKNSFVLVNSCKYIVYAVYLSISSWILYTDNARMVTMIRIGLNLLKVLEE